MIDKTCCFCDRSFQVAPRASRRSYCFSLECLAARRAYLQGYKLAFDRRQRELDRLALPSAAEPESPAPAEQRELRPCLRCGRRFASRGRHNRVCLRCHHSGIWRRSGSDLVPMYW